MFTLQLKSLEVLTFLLTGLLSSVGILTVYKQVCLNIFIATVNPSLPRKPKKEKKINVNPLKFFDV